MRARDRRDILPAADQPISVRPSITPAHQLTAQILALQRTAGNRAVTRLLSGLGSLGPSSTAPVGSTVVQRVTMELDSQGADALAGESTQIIRKDGGSWLQTDKTFSVQAAPDKNDIDMYTKYLDSLREILKQWKGHVERLAAKGQLDIQLGKDFKWVIDDLGTKLADRSSDLVGVFDDKDRLQAIALYSRVEQTTEQEGHVFLHDLLTNPARFDPESKKGVKQAALAATRYLINISRSFGYEGRIRLQPLESSKELYGKWGFRPVESSSEPSWEQEEPDLPTRRAPSRGALAERIANWDDLKQLLAKVKVQRDGAEVAALEDWEVQDELESWSGPSVEFLKGLELFAFNTNHLLDWKTLLAGLPLLATHSS